MSLWLKIIVYPSLVLFCTFLGGVIGVWIPAHGTEKDTGAAGVADGMGMILYGFVGLAIGLAVGIVLLLILMAWLERRELTADPAPPQEPEENGWPPAPRSGPRG